MGRMAEQERTARVVIRRIFPQKLPDGRSYVEDVAILAQSAARICGPVARTKARSLWTPARSAGSGPIFP